MTFTNSSKIGRMMLVMVIAGSGCMKLHRAPKKPMEPATSTTMPMPPQPPTTSPVATSDLGTVATVPGLAPKPKPFIALPKSIQTSIDQPSTLLLQHASPDSPVPISEYSRQPVHAIADFHLHSTLSSHALELLIGPPAQLADAEDPWWVYRLTNDREIWLHFTGPLQDQLDAADVIRGAETGYVRDRVFPAKDVR